MKTIKRFLFTLWVGIFAACNQPSDSVFSNDADSKFELKAQGFSKMKNKDPFTKRYFKLDDAFYKEYGDTVVHYKFDNKGMYLKEILFFRSSFDSMKLFGDLEKSGFKIYPVLNSPNRFDIVQPHTGTRFSVRSNREEILFTHFYRKPAFGEAPAEITIDSAKQ